ncbi:tyrosine-type recombinase/integrase [Cytobacillus gottheilii]|uniref:tyrosine-type recombinase/integrase n=1 Tax=Cytobacillus gottheilii TaxID=859144 RepID=UPI002493F439|nr:tyrosine-type recombinase/integrase [Cytobacillus gottheilii]
MKKENRIEQINLLRSSVLDRSILPQLQKRMDEAEKAKRDRFTDFNDIEMLQWYLYRKEHLNQEHEKASGTIKEYEKELSLFVEQLLTYAPEIDIDIEEFEEDSLFRSLSPRHIRRYQEWLAERSPHVKNRGFYSAATLARKTTVLKNFLLYMYEVKYITEPLHTGLYKATVKTDDRPNRDLGAFEVIQLLDYYRSNNHPIMFAIIHVLTTTGLRNEEFCRLKVRDLKYDSINNSYYLNVLGKGNKRRQVPLREKTLNSIKMFRYARGLDKIEVAAGNEPLFSTNSTKAYSPSYLAQYVAKQIKKTKQAFVINHPSTLSPHIFRHAFSIISYKSGVQPYELMKSLGHEKIETTVIYLQKVLEKEEHAIHKWTSEVFGDYI